MGRLKKFVSRLLTGVLLLSSLPFSSFADVNGGGNGNDSKPSTYEIVGSFHSFHANQGFRLTVVNAEGVAVSNNVDFVMYFPEELDALLEASKSGLAVREFTEYAVEPYKNNTGSMKGKPKRYIRYLGGCKTDPIYSISGGCAVFTDGMTESQIELNKNMFNGLESIIRVDGDYTKSGTRDGNLAFTDARMYTYEMLQFLLSIDGEKNGYVNPIDGAGGTHEYIDAVTGEKKVLPKKFQNPLTTYDVGGGISGFYAGGDEMRAQLMTPVEVKAKDDTLETQTIVQRILELEGFDVNGRGGRKSDSWVPIFQYIDPKLNEQVKELKAKGEKYPMSKVFKDNNLRLLIESVSWRIPGIVDPFDPRPEFRGGGGWELMQTSYCTDNIIYGTATSVYHYVTEQWYKDRKEKGWFPDMPNFYTDKENWLQWFCYTTGHGFAWQPAFNNDEYRLAQDAPDLGLYYYDGETQGSLYNLLKYWNSLGYAVMVTTLDGNTPGTPTWDKENYSGSNYKPAPSPENTKPDGSFPNKYPSEGEEYEKLGKDHQFNIVKFYAEKQPDGSYVYTENHTRNNTIHTININDEPSYKVDGWFTSPTFRQPTNKTDSYDDFKNTLPKGEKEGTKAESIVVKPESNDTTLYIRLISSPSLTIIKYFPDGSTKTEEIPWIPSYNSDEEGYVYEEDKQSPDKPDDIPSSYEATNGTPENNPIIPVKTDTRIVYIKYKDVEADSKITLHQNELAHKFTLENIQSLVTLIHSFDSKEHSGSGSHGSGSDRWHCSWHRVIDDDNYSYIISNKEDYSLTSFVGSQGAFTPQEIGNNNDSGSLGIGGGSTNGLTPNLKFSIYRDKIKDNVTLYQGKNSDSIKNELSNIYITKEGYKPLTERIKNEGETEWFSTFKINYTYDTEDNTLSWGSSGCGTHGDSGSWDGISNSLSEINNPFSQANNVLTKAFLGQPGIGDKESTLEKAAFNILGKTFNKNLVYEKLGEKYIQFFPYIKMKYNTVEDETNKEAYIVSTNESKVRNLSSVETGVYQSKNGFGINISSEQWSTHRKTTEGLKENGVAQAFLNKGLLPGGAVIKLNTSNTNNDTPEVWVGLRTYEMSIPDDLKVTLSSTDDIKTTSEAKANAEQLVEDVKNNLSNYHVEKWIKEGITTDENDLNSGASKVSGVTYKINNTVYKPVTRFGDNDLSTDSKYYLKEDVNGADSSKLDVINIDEETNKLKDTEIHIYNISSDTEGKVTVKKDGVEIASSNIKKDKNASSLLSNEEVRRVNDRVKFVENFIASLDFEEGKDRENRAWYYEAQDGIDVVEMTAAFHLGFGKDNAIRSEVADVKLTGKLDNKGDILNFDSSKLNEKTRTVQYRLSAAPANASCEKAGYIGTFNGQEIRVDKMYTVMRSRLYYMGNNTVMDLN